MAKIKDVLDGKAGFDLLVFGTIGSVLTAGVSAANISWPVSLPVDLASIPLAGAIGYGFGCWWIMHSGWYPKRSRRLLIECFLTWLDQNVSVPEDRQADFGLTMISTARNSNCSLMGDLLTPMGTAISETEQRAVAWRIVALAQEVGYQWRSDESRTWARTLL